MKTPTKQTARRLAAALAIATVFATTGASAATTTYYQVAATRDASCVFAADGLASDVEITSTPQLAFPGITLDDIPARATFYTTIYGDDVTGEMTAVGMHESRHTTDGSADKIALQCAVYDSSWIKGVVLVFTNGDGGVYVQVFGRIKKNGQYLANRYYDMAADGTLSSRWLNSGEFWTGSYPSGEEGEDVFRAKGLRIHGLSPSSTEARKALAFPGVKVADIADCAFVAGRRDGRNLGSAATDNWATYVTRWPAEGVATKLVMQFEHPTDSKKTAVMQLVNGEDGVYAFQSHHTWNGNANIQRFAIDADTGTVSASNTGGSSGATTDDPPNYAVHDLFLIPQCVPKYPNKIKVFSDPSKTLTLDDIEEGDFTARMYGGYINAAFNAVDSAKGYNKKVFRDDDTGNVTNIVVEFQVRDGSTKCLVASFENGADGVYASGLGTKYSSSAVGYEFYERAADGTETWHGSNPNSDPANCYAATWEANGYGVCDLRVTVLTVHKWTLDATKNWTTLSDGETVEADEVVKITVNDPAAVLTVDADISVGKIEFVGGNCAQLIVASGQTLTAEDITGATDIVNNGTLVKTGSETVSWPFSNDSMGVTIVSNGTLKVASKSGTGTSNPTHTVRVASGATFDANGVQNLTISVVLEDGAFFVNTGSDIGNTTFQTINLSLEGNATVTAGRNFGLMAPGYASTSIALGSNTLSFNGTAGFWLENTTITGDGTINVESGTLQCARANTTGANCTLNIGESGALRIDGTKTLCVSNFYNGGNLANGNNFSGTAYGKLLVNGTLTTGNAMTNITLAAGATVKATGTAQVVSGTFSASGTITVDASEITKAQLDAGDVPVLTVPATFNPSDITWNVTGEAIAGTRAKWRTDEGGATKTLYLARPTGLMVIVR